VTLLMTGAAAAGTAVSPTINVTPTSDPNTRTNARFPTNRPRRFMASTSLSASTSSRLHFSPPGVSRISAEYLIRRRAVLHLE
jgi:hypothetical protein